MKLITSLYLMKRNQEVHFVGKPPNVSAPNVMLSCTTSAFHGFMGYENKLLWLIYRIYIRFLKFIIFRWPFVPITFPWKLDFLIQKGVFPSWILYADHTQLNCEIQIHFLSWIKIFISFSSLIYPFLFRWSLLVIKLNFKNI